MNEFSAQPYPISGPDVQGGGRHAHACPQRAWNGHEVQEQEVRLGEADWDGQLWSQGLCASRVAGLWLRLPPLTSLVVLLPHWAGPWAPGQQSLD